MLELSRIVHLNEFHEKNGHVVDFAGFRLPLWFKGIISESLAVRNSVGIFDISHMGRMLVRGDNSGDFLNTVTTNDVKVLKVGDGQYSLICNEEGGIKDDLLVFHLSDCEYFVVYNAANRSKDYEWFSANAKSENVEIEDVSDQVAMFAIQGPRSVDVLQRASTASVAAIRRFCCAWTEIDGMKSLVSRTGYTGEDGFEIFVWGSPVTSPQKAVSVWNRLLDAGEPFGIEPCGLGARDLLRLEAGLCLYGTDMDESTNPYEAKLGFVVKFSKDFIGRNRLEEIKKKGTEKSRVGLVTVNRVIPRNGYHILGSGKTVGEVTSGSLSPIVDRGIAMGYVGTNALSADSFAIVIRERAEAARLVKPPFYDPTRYGYTRKN
jgi:aminomethyltransferase